MDLAKRLRAKGTTDKFERAIRDEAAARIEALEAVLRAGADIVSGTWDGIYGLEEELTWVREVEALLKSQPGDRIGDDKSEYGHEG
jgi:hypothetical protein